MVNYNIFAYNNKSSQVSKNNKESHQFIVLEVRLEWNLAIGDGGEQATEAAQLPLVQLVAGGLGRRWASLQETIGRYLVARTRIYHSAYVITTLGDFASD